MASNGRQSGNAAGSCGCADLRALVCRASLLSGTGRDSESAVSLCGGGKGQGASCSRCAELRRAGIAGGRSNFNEVAQFFAGAAFKDFRWLVQSPIAGPSSLDGKSLRRGLCPHAATEAR